MKSGNKMKALVPYVKSMTGGKKPKGSRLITENDRRLATILLVFSGLMKTHF